MTPRVSTAAIVCMGISGLVALLLPVFLFLAIRKRYRARVAPLLAGAAGFVVSVLVIESLFHRLLLGNPVIGGFLQSHAVLFALYGGLMAGLFEETARLVVFIILYRKRRGSHLGDGLAYGIGHGGIEAVLLCTVSMVLNIVLAVMHNAGNLNGLAGIIPDTQAFVASFTGLPPGFFLISAYERIIAIFLQIAFSILVWMAVTGRGPKSLYFLALLLHLVVDFPAGLYQAGAIGLLLTEILFTLIAVIICFVVFQIYEKCAQSYTPLLNYNPSDFGIR